MDLSTDEMIPTVGTILGGSYIIPRSLAEGGRDDVYVAAHERLTRQVAIKILRTGVAEKARVVARLRREADIMCALRHPHIVQILGFIGEEVGARDLEAVEDASISWG